GTGRGKAQWLLIKRPEAFARSADHAGRTAREHGRTTAGQAPARTPSSARERPPAHVRRPSEPPEDGMTYTHIEKLMYPESGIRKGDVLAYYQRIATRLLPHLHDRPATLERWPEGLDG